MRPLREMTRRQSLPGRAPRSARRIGSILALLLAALLVGACGGDDGPPLEPLAAEGRDIARDSGCAACHGRNGEGGVGPSWIGRFGTTIELEGGRQVVVDHDYLTRSIREPGAERVAGFSVEMPGNNLDDEQIAAVLAYIEALR